MPMSGHPGNSDKLRAPASPVVTEKTRIQIFLPSSLESYAERQDGELLLGQTEGLAAGETEDDRQPPLVDEWDVAPKLANSNSSSTMAHPLYQAARHSDEAPKLKPRFAKFAGPGADPAAGLSTSPRQANSSGLLGKIDGLPGPGISRNSNFLASYSHNYGQSEGGKTWWSAK